MDVKTQMLKAVCSLDALEVRKLLDSYIPEDGNLTEDLLMHEIVWTYKDQPEADKERSEIIFMLCNAGFDINSKDEAGLSPLHHSVQLDDVETSRSLLQCGADMNEISANGVSILDEVLYQDEISEQLFTVFKDFQPGLWEAVRQADVKSTRRLVNLWCRTDLRKDGKELKEVALDSGVEGIIGLILNVEPSMKLVHHLLAGDIKSAHQLLNTIPQHINFNFRNLNDHGAPILYYVIQKQLPSVISKMRQYDCRLYSVMRDESGFDMPVFFSCLKPEIEPEVVGSLLEGKDVDNILVRILYKGKTVLEVAIENDIGAESFDILVKFGGPDVLTNRNKFDETPREYATRLGKFVYVRVIDQNVSLWLHYPEKYPGKRQTLALCGYTNFVPENAHNVDKNFEDDGFLQSLPTYQRQISNLCLAAESGDLETFKELMAYSSQEDYLFITELFWRGRAPGEGLPILHRAVLWEREQIIKLIFSHKPKDQSIDNLLDQYHRTAIHYALGLKNASSIISQLMDQGCSEHTLDKNGKEPLDFKLKRNTTEMQQLIYRLKTKDFKSNEPEPWNVTCPVEKSSYKSFPTRFYHSHNHRSLWTEPVIEEESYETSTCIIL